MSGKVDLERWGPHLAAAKRQGKSIKRYAAEHGVSPYTLYAARQMLKARAHVKTPEVPAGSRRRAFAEVRLPQAIADAPLVSVSAPRLRARLPNGIALELCCETTDTRLVRALVDSLMGRR